jgi:hypothetical protein
VPGQDWRCIAFLLFVTRTHKFDTKVEGKIPLCHIGKKGLRSPPRPPLIGLSLATLSRPTYL